MRGRLTHGHSRRGKYTPTFRSWMSMRARVEGKCGNEKSMRIYFERGIKICDRWQDFSNFLADMGERPSKLHTLDRIDTNGHYEPGNCRWATWDQQNKNQRSTRYLTHEGVTLCMKDWAKKIGIRYQTLHERLQRGWPVDKALTIPASKFNSNLRYRRGPETRRRPVKTKAAHDTHCKAGHEFTPENTSYAASGKPECKTCHRIRYRVRGGWTEEQARTIPVCEPGQRPVNAHGFRKRAARKATPSHE